MKWGLSKKPKVNLYVLSIIFHDFQNVESRWWKHRWNCWFSRISQQTGKYFVSQHCIHVVSYTNCSYCRLVSFVSNAFIVTSVFLNLCRWIAPLLVHIWMCFDYCFRVSTLLEGILMVWVQEFMMKVKPRRSLWNKTRRQGKNVLFILEIEEGWLHSYLGGLIWVWESVTASTWKGGMFTYLWDKGWVAKEEVRKKSLEWSKNIT